MLTCAHVMRVHADTHRNSHLHAWHDVCFTFIFSCVVSCGCVQDLVQEVLNHLETLSQHVGITAADILQRMKTSKLQELMGGWLLMGSHACSGRRT